MRIIAIILTLLVYQSFCAQNISLKIQNEDTYFYPSNLSFEVLDKNENLLFTQNDLKLNKPIKLEGPYTINVFTEWGDGKDTFKVDNKTLIAFEKQGYSSKNSKNRNQHISKHSGVDKFWRESQPNVVSITFENNNNTYDATIEFENDIFFNYIDGKVKITQNGKTLELLGNYVAKTSEGYLKISYNSKNKEYWYVFTDTFEKVIYQ